MVAAAAAADGHISGIVVLQPEVDHSRVHDGNIMHISQATAVGGGPRVRARHRLAVHAENFSSRIDKRAPISVLGNLRLDVE